MRRWPPRSIDLKPSLRDFLALTKPTINLLVLVTGATALVLEGSLVERPGAFALVLLGLFLVAGCANALNQYFERDIDARMKRTAKKRPLPSGRMSPRTALVFATACGVLGVGIFAVFFNAFSALLGLGTILFYSLFYTLYLKPRTPLNIVIGGAAGAMGPVIAWAAAAGATPLLPWVLFAIIFFWTPPHFWSLAFCLKEDYRAVSYPMMPNARGDAETMRQIVLYTLVTIAVTLAVPVMGGGVLGLVMAAGMGGYLLYRALLMRRTNETREAWGMFGYSIVYLLLLFVVFMVDATIDAPWNTLPLPGR